jgi:hypothetical protein
MKLEIRSSLLPLLPPSMSVFRHATSEIDPHNTQDSGSKTASQHSTRRQDISKTKMGNAQNLSLEEDEETPVENNAVKETRKSLIQGTSLNNNDTDVIYSTLDDGSSVSRKRTETESVVVKRKNVVHEIMSRYCLLLLLLSSFPPFDLLSFLLLSDFQSNNLFQKFLLIFLSC